MGVLNILKEYILQNWALVLVLIAFVIMLSITVFLDKKSIRRMYALIFVVFVLSIIVFFEFYLADINKYHNIRIILISIRYSSTPIIISLVLFTLFKKGRWFVIIPAIILTIINIVSIFTGIVVSINSEGELNRGIFGYLPYIGVGIYSVVLIYILYKRSNKQAAEIMPIVFLAFSLLTGLVFPLIFGKDYSKIFCSTIGIALFVYYVFLILQLTKKDALTGLLNRQAYYAYIENNHKDITAIISIDMNGLKIINDTYGHEAGDEALIIVSNCFLKEAKSKYSIFRIGGDEFIIICKKTPEDELLDLVASIKKSISETNYSISLGYSIKNSQDKNIDEMLKESDKMMYQDKADYYAKNNIKGH